MRACVSTPRGYFKMLTLVRALKARRKDFEIVPERENDWSDVCIFVLQT